MTTRKNIPDSIAVGIAVLLLFFSPMINAAAMIVLAALGLIVMTLFFRKRLTEGAALSASVGFVVAFLISLGKCLLHYRM